MSQRKRTEEIDEDDDKQRWKSQPPPKEKQKNAHEKPDQGITWSYQ